MQPLSIEGQNGLKVAEGRLRARELEAKDKGQKRNAPKLSRLACISLVQQRLNTPTQLRLRRHRSSTRGPATFESFRLETLESVCSAQALRRLGLSKPSGEIPRRGNVGAHARIGA